MPLLDSIQIVSSVSANSFASYKRVSIYDAYHAQLHISFPFFNQQKWDY